MKKAQENIGILASFSSKVVIYHLSNLVRIIGTFSNSIYVIVNSIYVVNNEAMNLPQNNNYKIKIFGTRYDFKGNLFTKIINFIGIQLNFSSKIVKLTKDVDIWIFFIGSHSLLLPILTAKLMRKKIVIALVGSTMDLAKAQKNTFLNILVYNVLIHSEKINYTLSSKIILHSPNYIKEWGLEKYRKKISIAHEYFLNFNKFKVKKKVDERENLIGYIGRLSMEKGILNFVKAIPQIIKEKDGLQFLIGGDGPLRDEIEKYINEEKLNNIVRITGWIPDDEFPDYLNELKLLVIPSYTESGPVIVQEAMACGTPILTTRTYYIVEMIEDGKAGFIMENNSPECIARNVIKNLNHPNLEEITKNARALVEREFTYEKAVEGYRKILEDLK